MGPHPLKANQPFLYRQIKGALDHAKINRADRVALEQAIDHSRALRGTAQSRLHDRLYNVSMYGNDFLCS